MATRTATKNGFMSDTTVWGAAIPVANDSLVLNGFVIYADYSLAIASLTTTTGSAIIPANGNVTLTISAVTATNPLVIQGSPNYVEFDDVGTYVAKGLGGT